MTTKAQQNDDGTVSDPVTTETQKDYANYEKEQQEAQKKRDKEGPFEYWGRKLKRTFLGIDDSKAPVKKAKGGKVSSASKRADGCAIRGKTRA
jgi:hypothetical protein